MPLQWNNLIPLSQPQSFDCLTAADAKASAGAHVFIRKKTLILIGKLRVRSHFLMMPINHRQCHLTRVLSLSFSQTLRPSTSRPTDRRRPAMSAVHANGQVPCPERLASKSRLDLTETIHASVRQTPPMTWLAVSLRLCRFRRLSN